MVQTLFRAFRPPEAAEVVMVVSSSQSTQKSAWTMFAPAPEPQGSHAKSELPGVPGVKIGGGIPSDDWLGVDGVTACAAAREPRCFFAVFSLVLPWPSPFGAMFPGTPP